MKVQSYTWKAPLRNINTGKEYGRDSFNTAFYFPESQVAIVNKRYFIDWEPQNHEEVVRTCSNGWTYVQNISYIGTETAEAILQIARNEIS